MIVDVKAAMLVQHLPIVATFRIRASSLAKKVLLRLEAPTHQEAANSTAAALFRRTVALRMSSWNGRDGVFAALCDMTGKEEERFFVENEDGTGKIRVAPGLPPSLTAEDAKRLRAEQAEAARREEAARKKRRRRQNGRGKARSVGLR